MNTILMIRGFTQYIVAALLALQPVILATEWLVNEAGLPFNKVAVATTLEAILFSVITGALNKAGEKWPIINQLMSMGTSKSGPAYVPAGDSTAAVSVDDTGTTTYTESGEGHAAPPTFETQPSESAKPPEAPPPTYSP